jgi:hypothetical protein
MDDSTIRPRVISASPRKFTEYVLDPTRPGGKDRVFLNRLGYRAWNDEDANTLAALYVQAAQTAIHAGTYAVRDRTAYGLRITIPVEVRGVVLLTGWLFRPDGALTLATPFSGFARGAARGEGP